MKTTIIISLLSLATLGAYAQSNQVCPKPANMPKNAVMVYPKSAYTPVGDPSCPPCYLYTRKSGLQVMECPYAWFKEGNDNNNQTVQTTRYSTQPTQATTAQTYTNGVISMESQRSYTGNYNYSQCAKDLRMPSGATPVYPKSAYVPTGNPDCPPCYEYTTKSGLKVMECPNLWFVQDNK